MEPTALPTAEISEVRRAILGIVKRRGPTTIAELADELSVSYEAVRQQIAQLHREGWLQKRIERGGDRARVGRPLARYRLTAAGDHLFPKLYDRLTVAVLDAVSERFGPQGLNEVLDALAERQIEEWLPRIEGLGLEERLEALRDIYQDRDPFVSIERAADGDFRLVERNCPFLNVATERPEICGLTVMILSRLLGRGVVREDRFQNGDGRCSFHVLAERPAEQDAPRLELEPVAVPV